MRFLSTLLAVGLVFVTSACGSGPGAGDGAVSTQPPDGVTVRLGHIHGLGVNPADNALFVASHLGVYRVSDGQARRVANRYQDTMAFTVIGADKFLASGHPDIREDLPAHLGLIESTDAARTWQPLSLQGEADFHALEPAGDLLYGYDGITSRVMVTRDHVSWSARSRIEVLDLAAHPGAPEVLAATTPDGQFLLSRNGGAVFTPVVSAPRLAFIDWVTPRHLVGVAPDGTLHTSQDSGRRWRVRGRAPGNPQAFDIARGRWHLATETVIYASDDGVSWTPVRIA
jgi:hypothetical protein